MGILDFITNPIASLVSGLGGAAISSSGQASANAANERINKENIAFQEEMSNTAVQRRAKDMEAAGINPILAAGNPASQPSVSMLPMQNKNQAYGNAGTQIATAIQGARLTAAQAENLEAQADLTRAQTPGASAASAAAGERNRWEIENLRKQVEERIANFQLTDEQRAQIHSMMPFLMKQAEASIASSQQATSASKTAQSLDAAKLPGAQAEAEAWRALGAAGKGADIGAGVLSKILPIVRSLMH